MSSSLYCSFFFLAVDHRCNAARVGYVRGSGGESLGRSSPPAERCHGVLRRSLSIWPESCWRGIPQALPEQDVHRVTLSVRFGLGAEDIGRRRTFRGGARILGRLGMDLYMSRPVQSCPSSTNSWKCSKTSWFGSLGGAG
ncbi:hypothetical protein LY76DRAFT_53262 [Colletotrichum caudatum]|nr:hypothetical protein LY76DRAFT_53262 [Colletotrichum caudatum]